MANLNEVTSDLIVKNTFERTLASDFLILIYERSVINISMMHSL